MRKSVLVETSGRGRGHEGLSATADGLEPGDRAAYVGCQFLSCLLGLTSQHASFTTPEVAFLEGTDAGGMQTPVETTSVGGTTSLDEELVDGEAVSDGVPPGLGCCTVVGEARHDVVVDVGQDHLLVWNTQQGLDDHLDVGLSRLLGGDLGGGRGHHFRLQLYGTGRYMWDVSGETGSREEVREQGSGVRVRGCHWGGGVDTGLETEGIRSCVTGIATVVSEGTLCGRY